MLRKTSLYGSLIMTALLLAATLCQYKGDAWEEKVRKVLYNITGDTIPSFSTTLTDKDGIPYVQYAPENGIAAGTQYNATIVGNYAIDYHDQFMQTGDSAVIYKFRNCINWLSTNMTKENDHGIFIFNWQQPWYPLVKTPFTGGMTSGRAIEAFIGAYKIYKDSIYLNQARLLRNGYYLAIHDGGFTYKDPQGWWYEELADTNLHTPKILDGHIYALQGIQKLWQLTKHDSDLLIVNNGIAALKHDLPFYDAGNGRIYYDVYKKLADQHYQEILANQMMELWQSTRDSVFYRYYKKWNAPLQRPYLLRILKERNRSGILLYLFITFVFSITLFIGYKLIFEKKVHTQPGQS